MSDEPGYPGNPIAVAGLAFALVALLLYVVAWVFLKTLPSSIEELSRLRTSTSELTRFVVTTGGAALLNLVAVILSVIGLLLPRRPRLTAAMASLLAAVMLIAIPGVITVSLLFGDS